MFNLWKCAYCLFLFGCVINILSQHHYLLPHKWSRKGRVRSPAFWYFQQPHAGNHVNSVSSLPLKKWKKMNFSKFRLFFHYQICNQVNMNITEMFLPDLICREVTMKTLQTGHPSQSHLIYNIRMLGLWSIVLLTGIFIYAVGQWFVPFQLYYNKMLIDQ